MDGSYVAVDAVAVGAQGQVIAAGSFSGTVDFGGGPLVQQGVAYNLFVVEFDCSGKHVWSKRFGAPDRASFHDTVWAMALAPDGGILLTGQFEGPLDFGAGAITTTNSAGYVAKLDATGNGLWSMRFGDTMDDHNVGTGIAADAAGNVYVAGDFFGPVSFGANVIGQSSQVNVFAAELDSMGNVVWAKAFGAANLGFFSFPTRLALAVDVGGKVVLCGNGRGATFDFGGMQPLANAGLFAAKLDGAGGYVWAQTWATSQDQDDCRAVATGPSGEIVVTGNEAPLGTTMAEGVYVAKLTSAGATVFYKHPNSFTNLNGGFGVAVDGSGNVYVAGRFEGSLDLGSGPVMGNPSVDNAFAAKLGPMGTVTWLKGFTQTMGSGRALALALDASDTPIIGGTYGGMLDLGNGPLPKGMGVGSAFVARLPP